MTTKLTTDICIIGAGSGGLSVAAAASQMGAKVVLFEANKMGGDCLNTGCVPSKAMLAAAKAAHHAKGAPKMGVAGAPAIIDFAAVKGHVADVIATIEPHDSAARFTELGVTVIPERAHFSGRRQISSDNYQVDAKYIVIATGSAAAVPPIPGLDDVPYYTNETIFSDPQKPDHLVIIGGGPIGIEMAQAHARLGVTVTIIEAASIMSRDDPELVAILKTQLTNEGITIIEGTGITDIARDDANKLAPSITVALADGRRISGSHILVAAGRRPSIAGLNLEAGAINSNSAGIITDRRLRSSNKSVFAIGDVTGRAQFTHIAGYHAGITIRNMLFKLPAKIDETIQPWVTYCDPELAHVGLGEQDAIEAWGAGNVKTLTAPLCGNDRAIAERRREGMVKVVTHKNGRILGASILAPHAGEMILAWALAISAKHKISKMASIIAPYPTYGDASKRAAGSFYTASLFSARTKKLVKFLLRF